jgi:tRNA (guanine37-N1)-methyltransferase
MRIDIVTIFPEVFHGPFSEGVVRIAQEKGLLEIQVVDLRQFTTDKHKTVDDKPYGGGPGMVMKVEPIFRAVAELKNKRARAYLLSPQGRLFDQSAAKNLVEEEHVILICGKYKGVDERVTQLVDDEISIGDYVLSGGELGAMVVADAVARLIPGVIGDFESAIFDSFHGQILDAPYYTRPSDFEGWHVPETLLSGDHDEIRRWRKREALRRTLLRRPDLLEEADLDRESEEILRELKCKRTK